MRRHSDIYKTNKISLVKKNTIISGKSENNNTLCDKNKKQYSMRNIFNNHFLLFNYFEIN
jgi:hypothetical protein